MGFSMYLMLVFLVMIVADIFAFLKGKQNKQWKLFIMITSILIVGMFILGYLWITLPM